MSKSTVPMTGELSQPLNVPSEVISMATQGGVAVAAIFAVAYLIGSIAKMVEAIRKAD
jgi:hypothetical protein